MRYYKVETKCGHVGRKRYTTKTFYVRASNGKEAAEKIRFAPRVKHHFKDAIKSVTEITHEEYKQGCEKNANDPFFQVDNPSDQRMRCEFKEGEILACGEKHSYKKNRNIKKNLIYGLLEKEWKMNKSNWLGYSFK